MAPIMYHRNGVCEERTYRAAHFREVMAMCGNGRRYGGGGENKCGVWRNNAV